MLEDRFKFRLYDKAIGEMVYDVCVGFIKDNSKTDDWVCADTSCGQITYKGDRLKDIVLMQCTGLRDYNNNLIYEGDIIQDLTHLYICAFLPIFGGLGLTTIQDLRDYNFLKENWKDYAINDEVRKRDNRFRLANRGNKLTCFNIDNLKRNSLKIIGNMYQDPELLEDR